MQPSILTTKLFIPEIRENSIERKPLVSRLIHGINRGNSLSLVSAPAGYGKTTLVLELLKSIDLATAWISLDECDNDISQFLRYMIAALKKAGAAIGGSAEELALDFNTASTNAPVTMIINDISAQPSKFILVLDDFHVIHSVQVVDAVRFLLDHQPPNLHLAIITREDPALPLPRLRARGRITEVRMEDLCFGREEAADFFSRVMQLKLTGEAVDAIAARTEGWIAGLQLAGLSLSGCEERDVGEFIKVFCGTHRYIIDYLVEEVLNRQTDEVREFLCKTSVLDRMNGELCDAVVGRSGCRLLLRGMEKSNLFLIPLDSKGEWYRYHHLFADSLRTELSREEELLLHQKAALWLEDNGYAQEAVEYAFRSGDMKLALRLVEAGMDQTFRNAQLTTFVRWLKLLPDELVKSSEMLSVRKAWALLMIGSGDEALVYLNSLGERFLEKATPHNKGLLLSLQAAITQYSGLDGAEKQAEEALLFLEPWDLIMRIAALNTLGRAQEDNGKTEEAIKTLRMAYEEGRGLGYTFVTTLTLMNLGTRLNDMGRRKEALALFAEYIDGMTREFGKPLPFIGILYVGMAGLYYDSNELEAAKRYMDEGSELCRGIFYNWIENKGMLESGIQFAVGDRDEAIDTIRKSIDASPAGDVSEALVLNIAALVHFLLRRGNLEEAGQYGERLKAFMCGKGSTARREACLPYARLLVYQSRTGEALDLLESLEEPLEKTQKGKELIAFYILYSKAFYDSKEFEKADSTFEKAVRLAEPQGYYRLFLDEEPIVKPILSSVKAEEGAFIRQVVEYMNAPPGAARQPGSAPADEAGKPDAPEPVESLSPREIEILVLLGKGMSNNEIAQTLYITINTTQWHISHIYSKLGVRSRTQAVLRAKELKIR